MIHLAPYKKCTGCGACYNSCPQKAISMKANRNGFKYPVICVKKCVTCGICEKTCPVLKEPVVGSVLKCYVAETQNKTLHIMSSSGGVFGILAQLFIQDNGLVAGCAWDSALDAKHILVDNENELARIYTSKYVQSDIGECFVAVKKVLNNGQNVLFSGTPCQVAGLNAYLGKKYDNLITVEIICHGVPSPSVFAKYREETEKKCKSKISNVNFRKKDCLHGNDYIEITFNNHDSVKSQWGEDVYFRAFLKNFFLRECCYDCSANNGKSFSDITLGDFWGINKLYSQYSEYGYSAVIIRSKRGADMWNRISSKLIFTEVSYDDICKGNHVCLQSVKKPLTYNFYMNTYKVLGLRYALYCSDFLNKVLKKAVHQ